MGIAALLLRILRLCQPSNMRSDTCSLDFASVPVFEWEICQRILLVRSPLSRKLTHRNTRLVAVQRSCVMTHSAMQKSRMNHTHPFPRPRIPVLELFIGNYFHTSSNLSGRHSLLKTSPSLSAGGVGDDASSVSIRATSALVSLLSSTAAPPASCSRFPVSFPNANSAKGAARTTLRGLVDLETCSERGT